MRSKKTTACKTTEFLVSMALGLSMLGAAQAARADWDTDPDAKQQRANRFYDNENVITVNVTMDPDDWNALMAELPNPQDPDREGDETCQDDFTGDRFDDYPVESVTISGTLFPEPGGSNHLFEANNADDISITKKSYCGSFSKTKPSFKLKFDNEFENQLEGLIGVSTIVFNNSKQDNAYVRQCLGYELVKEAGLAYPRCNFAKVFINNNLFAHTYVNLEAFKKRLIKHNFDDNAEGNLYEFENDEDFSDAMMDRISLEGWGPDETKQDLQLATQVINEIAAVEKIEDRDYAELEQIIDIDRFIRFWALEVILKHWDGYSGNQNNTYVYNDVVAVSDPGLEDLEFEFLMSGIDQTLKGDNDANNDDVADDWIPGDWELYHGSVLGDLLYKDPYYLNLLWDQIYSYLDTLFSPANFTGEIEPFIDQLQTLVNQLLEDTGRSAVSSTETDRLKQMFQTMRDEIDELYGRKSKLNIKYPTESETVPAGAYDDPGKIWVIIELKYHERFDTDDFEVEINGEVADIVSAYFVQNQLWMVVNAKEQTASGRYDLVVRELMGGTEDTEENAVEYAEPGIPVDSLIVGDISGSMSICGKLEAAQNAARLFVDHAGEDDNIGVVSFSTDSYLDFALAEATETNLEAAREAINDWETVNMTALGKGVQEGLAQLLSSAANPDHDWEMALLSDGKQNIHPYWNTDEVKGAVLEASQPIRINTVALGADADLNLMSTIATDTQGDQRVAAITYCPELAAFVRASVTGLADDFNLTNELADVYKGFAEKARLEDRIGDWTGAMDPESYYPYEDFYLTLESGLPEVIIALNWDSEGTPLGLYINDTFVTILPEGEVTQDETHVQYRLQDPAPGEYKITVANISYYPVYTPYRLMASARSLTSAMPAPSSIQPTYTTDDETVPIRTFVGDDVLPISDAGVIAVVTSPTGVVQEITLADDGAHSDGNASDGLYGGEFVPDEEGPYSVVILVSGVDNNGNPFTRRDPTVVIVGTTEPAPDPVCVLGENHLDLRDRVVATADIAAGSYLEIGTLASPANLVGNGVVGGNAMLRSNAAVDGNLMLAGVLNYQGPYTITGTLTENASPLIPVLTAKTVTAGTGSQTIGSGAVPPGDYGDVTIDTGASVVLGDGVYNFASLNVLTDVEFHAVGFVEVNIEGNFQFGDRSEIFDGNGLTVYANGTEVRIGTDVGFTGVLSAPNAAVIVYSRTEVNGCVGGENVTLDADVILTSNGKTLPIDGPAHPSEPTCNDGIQNGEETGIDCGGDVCDECDDGRGDRDIGESCRINSDCMTDNCVDFVCRPESVVPVPTCTESTAIDLGAPGNQTAISTDGCVMVRNQYPFWWGTRTMMLQTTSPGDYPVSFTWSNACTGNSGTGLFTGDWQNQFLSQTSQGCATLIHLQGAGTGTIRLRYYGG